MRKKGNDLPLLQRGLGGFRLKVIMCALLAILVFCGHASADPAKYKPNSAWDLSYVLPPSPAIGDLYGFLGVGQPTVIKPGGAGLVLKSRGTNQMPGWEVEGGAVDWANPGEIGSGTANDATFVTSKHTSEYAVNFNARTVYTEKGVAENGDLYGFIGSGQSSLVKSGPTGYALISQGVGTMPAWIEPLLTRSMSIGTLDISNGGPTSTSVTCGFAPRLATFRIGFFEGSNTGLEYASGVGWTDFSSVWSEATRNTYSAGYHEFGASTAFVQLYQSGGSIYSTSVTQGANGFTVNWTHGGASGTANWMALCFR